MGNFDESSLSSGKTLETFYSIAWIPCHQYTPNPNTFESSNMPKGLNRNLLASVFDPTISKEYYQQHKCWGDTCC